MEETTTPNLRSRSRSKTPSIQLNHDREEVAIENGQTKSGRKTPVISRDTPTRLTTIDPIAEDSEPEVFTSPPAHRTRNALRHRTTPIPQTSEFSMDQNDFASTKTHIYSSTSEEQTQNLKNYAYEYERITTSSSYDRRRSANRTTVSPTGRPQPSPSGSERSNESFVDSILADCSRMSDDGVDHLPYRLYKSAVEYWNKYPKTDYTYSRLSKDRVELAPGQVAVPNMSRPSLHSAGWGGSSQDLAYSPGSSSYSSTETRQRYLGQNNYGNHRMHESISDTELDEATSSNYAGLKSRAARAEHWWITSLLITVWTTIVTTTTTVRDKILRRDGLQGYPYSAIRNYQAYSTRTEETTWYTSAAESVKRRRWWLLLLPLLLLPFAFWYCGGNVKDYYYPYAIYSSKEKDLPVVIERPGRFEITDDLINTIVLRVKQSLPAVESPPPQIIERIVEKSNDNFDPSILTKQQELINELMLEINTLKAANNDDYKESMTDLISRHTTRTIVQLLGLPATDDSSVAREEVKDGLLRESRDYVDEKLSAFQYSVSSDLGKITEGVKSEIKGLKKDIVVQSGSQQFVHSDSGCHCDDKIREIVASALLVYDADKTGLVDYALESAGGQVVSTRCTESYQANSAVFSVLGIPLWYPSNSPRTVITPGTSPGECWAFTGFPGYLVIKLYKRVAITGFTLEHTPGTLTPYGQIESAPKKFTVWGFQDLTDREPVEFGSFEYQNDSTPLQYFPADPVENKSGSPPGHDLVELRIESNHGNPLYTCVYRFRVHGEPIDHFTFFGDGPDR